MASVSDLSDVDLYERWEWERVQDEHPPNEVLLASLEREAKSRGFNLKDVVYSLGITAARIFDPDLHPRGLDGRFIEKLGLIELFGLGGNVKDGRRGTVVDITPDPKKPGNPTIKVRVDDPVSGKAVMYIDVKPENIKQAPEAKARLNNKANPADVPEAGIPEGGVPTTGVGTKDDPIRTSDVDVAAQAVGEGKYVELDQPSTVSVFLDRIKEMTDDAKAKGEQAPTYDLCLASVAGTNLFCAETKNIPRIRMPQLKTDNPQPGTLAATLPLDDRGEADGAELFVQYLKDRGIDVTEDVVPADTLRPSQNELNGAKVAGIMQFMEGGGSLDGKIFITSDDYVVDGHHRWAAQVGAGITDQDNLDIAVDRIDAPILQVLAIANNWTTANGFPHAEVAHVEGQSAPDANLPVTNLPPGFEDIAPDGELDANAPDFRERSIERLGEARAQDEAAGISPEDELIGMRLDTPEGISIPEGAPEVVSRMENFLAEHPEIQDDDTQYGIMDAEAGFTPDPDKADMWDATLNNLDKVQGFNEMSPQDQDEFASMVTELRDGYTGGAPDEFGNTPEADAADLQALQDAEAPEPDVPQEGPLTLSVEEAHAAGRDGVQQDIDADVTFEEAGVEDDAGNPLPDEEALANVSSSLLDEDPTMEKDVADEYARGYLEAYKERKGDEGEAPRIAPGDESVYEDPIVTELKDAIQADLDDGVNPDDITPESLQPIVDDLMSRGASQNEIDDAMANLFPGGAVDDGTIPPEQDPTADVISEAGPEGDGRGEGGADDLDAKMRGYGLSAGDREDALRSEFDDGPLYDTAEDEVSAQYGIEINDIYDDPEAFDALHKKVSESITPSDAEGGAPDGGVEVRPLSDGRFGLYEDGYLMSVDENKFDDEATAQAKADSWNKQNIAEREALTPIPSLAVGDVKSVTARNQSGDVMDFNIEGVTDAEKAKPQRNKLYVVDHNGEMTTARITGISGGQAFADIGDLTHGEVTPDMIIGKSSLKTPEAGAPSEGADNGIAEKMSIAGAHVEGDQVVGTPGDYQGSATKLLDGSDSPIGTRVVSVKDGKVGEVVGYDKSDGYVKVKYDGDPKTYARSKRTLKGENSAPAAPAAESATPEPAAPAAPEAPAAPAAPAASSLLDSNWGDPEIKKLLDQTDSIFREEGVQYTVEDLMDTRSDRLADEIAYAIENGDTDITLKPPSGTEQQIPLAVAIAWAKAHGITLRK